MAHPSPVMDTPRTFIAPTLARWAWAMILFLALSASHVAAQSTVGCDVLLSTAQDHYTNQQFGVAERAARDCIAHSEGTHAQALDAYRLLALIHLRQAQVAEAEEAVAQLLDRSPSYVPDAISDPPAYVTLVETLRGQRPAPATAAPPPPLASSEAPPAAEPVDAHTALSPPAEHVFHVGLSLGAGSYSGERGIDGESLAEEFSLNGGFSFALDGTYAATSNLSVVGGYRAVRFPILLTNDVRAEDVQVRPEDSSAWVHILSFMARGHMNTGTRVRPYAQAGISGFFSRLNAEMRVGLGPQLGVGVDVPVTPEVVGFAELNFAVSIPGDAVDRVSTSAPNDLLTFMGAGLRYRIPTL